MADIAAVRKVAEKDGDIEALVRVIGTFDADIGEEVLTTRHFLIPGTKEYVTASVYYTDESVSLRKPGTNVWNDTTISVAIFVSKQKLESAFGKENNAVAEANYGDDILKVSVHKYAKVNRKLYSIAVDCICNGAIERPN